MEARGVKIYWDDRSGLQPWERYAREATAKDHREHLYIGRGFHECLNFATQHPDNRPMMKLYLPPRYYPAAANPLLLFASYDQQTSMGGYWVGVAGNATILPEDKERPRTFLKHKGALWYRAMADPALVSPFVVPIKVAVARHIGAKAWYRGPVGISHPELVLKEAAVAAAEQLRMAAGAQKKALLRQTRLIDRLLAMLDPAESANGNRGGGGTGGGWTPDPELGTEAELRVLHDQIAKTKVLRKKYPAASKYPVHVARDDPYADHDIVSAVEVRGHLVPTYIEVKGTTSAQWATVMISDRQVRLAETCGPKHHHLFAVVQFDSAGKNPQIHYLTLAELKRRYRLEPLKYRLVRDHLPRAADAPRRTRG